MAPTSCAQPSAGGVSGREIFAARAFAGEVPSRGGTESGMSVTNLLVVREGYVTGGKHWDQMKTHSRLQSKSGLAGEHVGNSAHMLYTTRASRFHGY